jgi:PIN domain nuclease of toxin-antitoxin system
VHFYLADTNALVWFLTGSPRLNAAARQVLLNRNSHVLIAVATFEDLRKNFNHRIGRSRRSEMPSALVVLEVAQRAKNVYVYPCDSAVVAEVLRLEHSHTGLTDPEDLQILATFLVLHGMLKKLGHTVAYVGSDSRIQGHLQKRGLEVLRT